MEESQEQTPIKPVENRKSDGTFGPGNNANPNGRPKGQSLKEYWRQRFYEMTDEEKIAFTAKVGNEVVWKMAEGNPTNDDKLQVGLTISEVLDKLENGNKVIRQTMAFKQPLSDKGQEEKLIAVPTEQSTGTLQSTQMVEKYNTQE